MTARYYSGSTTPFDPFVNNSAGLDRIVGLPDNLTRNCIWQADLSGGAVTIETVKVPSNSDEFMIRADTFTSAINSITVTAAAGQTIDGDATFTITSPLAWSRHRYDEATANWELIGGFA